MNRNPASGTGRQAASSGAEASIDHCSSCGAYLGLTAPSKFHPAQAWLCGRCGSAYFAARVVKADSRLASSARRVAFREVLNAADIDPAARRTRIPRRDLNRFLQFLSSMEHEGHEKRREERYPAAMPVLAIPLAADFRVIGPAEELTTINISRGGASLLDLRPTSAVYFAVDFSYASLGDVQVIMEVLRVRQFLSTHEIAGRWLCRISPLVRCNDNAMP